jgi:single-stranded-DNA-specific exonuclease
VSAADDYRPPTPVWLLRPPAPPHAVRSLSRSLGVPPLLAAMLWSRGLRDDAPDHLNPPLELTRIPHLESAAERLEQAIRGSQRILIHGDYDADGISGTAVLTLGLRELGATVEPYIPDRLADGYGIHPARVPEHAERCDLFVTVDCGITNLDEIHRLKEAGVEVIVTDHHTPGDAYPDCLVVHPATSPLARGGLPQLTGAGVAFHLLWALRQRLGLGRPDDYADLAAIGTIADVAPLLGENRALIVEGLRRLADSRWPGIRAVVKQSHLRGEVTARHVAFVIAPRLNAAGRLGEAELGLELLTTASERRASELAAYLDARNQDRRRIQDEMFVQALEIVDPQAPALVVEDPRWHPGVMGIVASKLLERFYRPVYIVAKGKGSVRSTPGISAVQGLREASRHLLRYGGHAQAAGFALEMESLPGFRDAILDYARRFPRPQPVITADAVLVGEEVERGLWQAIRSLEPFGEGHPAPLFALTDLLDAARAVGRESATLQLRIGGVKGVAWQMGALADALPVGRPVNAAVTLNENEWRERKTLEFVAEAVRPAERLALAPRATEPERETGTTPRVVRGALARAQRLAPTDLAGLREALAQSDALWLRALPPDDAVQALRVVLAQASAVGLDLDDGALSTVQAQAFQFPTLDDVRRGFVALRRGLRPPFEGRKAERTRTVLEELELVDGAGHVLSGEKRDPYASDTLLDGLVHRHLLLRFVTAYRFLDDDGFARSVTTLFGPADRGETRATSAATSADPDPAEHAPTAPRPS